ncbi:MAG: type IV secretion system DotC family protein [Desulfobacteraceae bacterium]|nr:type IV secretion system DotC family protein [Desulfobacteraceae bacterium]
MKKALLNLVLIWFLFSGNALANTPGPLEELSQMSSEQKKELDEAKSENQKNQLRLDAIKQAGVTVSIQTAVKYRYSQLNAKLERIALNLDKIDFALLLVHSGKIMPPIIREAKQALQIKSTTHSISSQQVYQILQPAKIVANTPTWRQYLIKEFKAIEEVNQLLLPQNDYEQSIWKTAVIKGWGIGIKQADNEFFTNWNRLVRDFLGLITYHRLALQGVVSVPMVAEGKFGIQIRNTKLDIDQRVFRITSPTKFNEANKWTPIIHTNKKQAPSGS